MPNQLQSANWTIEKYFTEAMGVEGGDTGGIYCIHFSLRSMQALHQGSLFNVHPHIHALVPAGIMKGGVFYEQRNLSTPLIAEIFRACPCGSKQGARLLTILLEHGVITQELISMLMCWNHHSGFNACPELVSGIPGMSIEKSPEVMSGKCVQKQGVYPLCRWKNCHDGSKWGNFTHTYR